MKTQTKEYKTKAPKVKAGIFTTDTTAESMRFKEFRLFEGLNQEKLAEILKKSQGTIQRYETGKVAIPIEIIKLLHKELNLSFNWFFTGLGDKKYIAAPKTLTVNVKELETNQNILMAQIDGLKKDYIRLYNTFIEFKGDVNSRL